MTSLILFDNLFEFCYLQLAGAVCTYQLFDLLILPVNAVPHFYQYTRSMIWNSDKRRQHRSYPRSSSVDYAWLVNMEEDLELRQPLNARTEAAAPDPAPESPAAVYQMLAVPCLHARSKGRFMRAIIQWLVCWPDYYYYYKMPTICAYYGIILVLSDTGTDVWVSWTHFKEGHVEWAGLTMSFIILAIVFALGYHVLYRRAHKWYEVHPVGPVYWSLQTAAAHKKQLQYKDPVTHETAVQFIHYTHELANCQKRTNYGWADETYLESYPELILQAYFVARLLSTSTKSSFEHPGADDVTWNMWFSICMSIASLLSYEATVAYRRPYVRVLFEPSNLELIVRIILDVMCAGPRLASVACYFTVEPKYITVPAFWCLHIAVTYISFVLMARRKKEVEVPILHLKSHEEFRGYRSHRSPTINHLRATLVSVLLPPTASWHEHAQRRKHGQKESVCARIRGGLRMQFILVSLFQFLESGVLIGIWLYCRFDEIKLFYKIATPTMVLSLLLIRPIVDVLCQMLLLSPVSIDEAEHCDRFKGLVAKTRLLQVGADILNNYEVDLLPPLRNLEMWFRVYGQDDIDHLLILRECQIVAEFFAPNQVISRQISKASNAKRMTSRSPKEIAPSQRPENEVLLKAVGFTDFAIFRRAELAAKKWMATDADRGAAHVEISELLQACQDRISLWKDVFLVCLNHEPLPKSFTDTSPETDVQEGSLISDYRKLIDLNSNALREQQSAA
ncbi:uncharacterized protein LOC129602592 [Paramacrobiotus metropolitanus]|uniref:uncharacterized protein LOC129602592 n=1 Tax=Paramacrobiotus metropolitanus TaxID=2943436 RepID=UPI002445C5AD|nr:uncharacterized protein LOC129602592 [Paramacrobiotus metropolitanus]